MKKYLLGIYYSLPVQLVILHLKRFQALLLFWYLLFSTIGGGFMHSFGADSLFLSPEYRGDVNAMSCFILGIAIGIFIMSWNITTFILFSRHIRFLATNSNPFLKYCINNGILPAVFLVFYFVRAIQFEKFRELMSTKEIVLNVLGFISGLVVLILISFYYFFRADRSIIRMLAPVISNPRKFKSTFQQEDMRINKSRLIKVEWYLNSFFKIRKPRDVTHYSHSFIETIFNRHHFAAVVSIFIAFLFLVLLGFNLDYPIFQLPAAAGITIFFAILIAVVGAFSYFMQSWSVPVLILLFFVFNLLFQAGIIDPSNKAYGLNYKNKETRPTYDKESLIQLTSTSNIQSDYRNMLNILEKWKAKQGVEKPIIYLITTSGGGNRSANFTMNILQQLDSLSGGKLMDKTFLISGASGGMLGATYYRALTAERPKGLNPFDQKYVDDISQDLLNSLFSSFVARDLAAPAQKFNVGNYEYIKDRGYAFEQKLNKNTRGLLDKQLKDFESDEANARMPLMLFNSVITRDGRKLVIGTQKMRFMMQPVHDTISFPYMEPDVVDFRSFFDNQDPLNLRVLTALRMNATFPYVLPNVWLPTNPVIDVMDAGLRDNYGAETAIRFLQVFREWILENTAGVVLIQIRDRKTGGWEHPYSSDDISEIVTKPFLLLQYNWYKMQEYTQNDLLNFTQHDFGNRFQQIVFQYVPRKEDAGAALNFHLTQREVRNIREAIHSEFNAESFERFKKLQLPLTIPALTKAE
jgi:hypothetical protein